MNDKEQIINMILSNEAQERFKRIKTYHITKGTKIEQHLLGFYSAGRITKQLSDEDLLNFINEIEKGNNEEEVVVKIDRRKRDMDLDEL